MTRVDACDPRDLYGDGIYPAALGWRNARLGEILAGQWTRASRRRSRLSRLRRRHAMFLAGVREPIGAPPHSRIPVEVLGPCPQPTFRCCRTGREAGDGCRRFNGCGCKVMLHADHGTVLLTVSSALEAQTKAAHALALTPSA